MRGIVAMSGGVDSSVCTYLLKNQGYGLSGVTFKMFSDEYTAVCGSLADAMDAKSICDKLDIPHYIFDFKEEFKKQVIEPFVVSYQNGLTPNPCIECNRHIKFKKLFLKAEELDCGFVSTGHYAIVEFDKSSGRYLLKKAKDKTKDQSYVLYSLTQQQLAKTVFPLGELTKNEVRDIAAQNNFINAKKPDSQDICFVPDGDYNKFIEKYTGTPPPYGNFLSTGGQILGRHKGITGYTIGQRKGLGIAFGTPMYVCTKNKEANTVTLGEEKELFSKTLTANDLNFIAFDKLTAPLKIKARTRYNMQEQSAIISPIGGGRVFVEFENPQRAITAGQAVVFYDSDVVIGGGTIE